MVSQKSAVMLTIAYKLSMAITGLVLIGFLVAHLMGNMLFFVGHEAVNEYGLKLREYPLLLWSVRGVLLLSVCVHIFAAIRLSALNKKAKPIDYRHVKPVKANLASRTMLVSGLLILFFILYHLAHFTFKWTHQDVFAYLDTHDVYSMISLSFKSPLTSGFYLVSVSFLMLHLYHGVRSFFQTLGMNHSRYNRGIRIFSQVLSILLALGFISIPLSVFLKIVE